MDQERIEKAAAFMHQTHIDGTGHQRIPEAIRPRDLDEAYAAQVVFHRLRTGTESPALAGYKIAATSKAIQEQVGLHEPFLGAILPGMIHPSPHALALDDYQQLGFECEIAVELGADLRPSGAPFDRDAVAAAVCAVYPAFELLDMRNCNLSGIDATSSITDNAMISGVVLGPATSAWRECGIGDLAGRLSVNGETRGEGNTRDALGHPLEGLAWIANNLAGRGLSMRSGMVVITGSIIATQFPGSGDRVAYEVEKLGRVELQVG